MKRLVKIFLASTALVFAAAVLLVVFLLSLDPNEHKAWIEDQFEQRTGWPLTLEGEVSYTLYPWLGVSVNKVTIDDGEVRTAEPPLFYADHAAFRTRLLPALRGHYEIDTVRLYGARINLRVDKNGVGNWRPGPQAGGPVATGTGPPAGLPLTESVIGGVDVKQTSVHWYDERSGQEFRIDDLRVSTGELVYGEPVAFDIDFDMESNVPRLSARSSMKGQLHYNLNQKRVEVPELTLRSHLNGPNVPEGQEQVGLDTSLSLNLDTDVLSINTLEFTGAGMQLSATAKVHEVQSPKPSLESDINLKGESLATLFTIAEMPSLVDRLSSLEEQAFDVSTRATVDFGRGEFHVPAFRAHLLGAAIEGRIDGKGIDSDTPVLKGTLNASGANLPTIVQVLGRLQGPQSPLADLGRRMDRIPSKSFDVDTEFNADLPNGKIEVPKLQLRLLGSRIDGNLTASALRSDAPRVSGNLQGAGPDLPLLINLAAQVWDSEESMLNRYAERLQAGALEEDFAVNVRFDVDWQRGNIDLPQLQAQALGLRLDGALTAHNMRENDGSVDGNLQLQGKNLPPLLSALDQDELPRMLREVKLKMDVSGSRNALRIEPLDLELAIADQGNTAGTETFKLRGNSLIDLDAGTATLEPISLTGAGIDINGRVDLRELMEAPHFDGHLTAAPFDPQRLLALFGQSLQEGTTDTDVLRKMSLQTDFSGDQDAIDLSNLGMTIDETTLAGTASVENFDSPAIRFNLSGDRLNVDRYLSAIDTGSAAGTTAGTTAQPTELPLALLRKLDIDGELTLDQLTVSGMQFTDLSTSLNATDGQIALAPISTGLYQGSYDGKLRLDAGQDTAQAEIQGTLGNVAVDPLLKDLLGASFVSGTGDIELSLNARGNTVEMLRDTLSGRGQAGLQDGVLRGINVSSVLMQVEAMIRARRLLDFERGEETAFTTFSATLDVDKGIVRSDDLALAASDLHITGDGILVNLKTLQMDYDLKTTVERRTVTTSRGEEYTTGGYTLPISCTGHIDNPDCAPSVEQVLRASLERKVRDKAGEFLQRALGGDEPKEAKEGEDADEDTINKALESIFGETP